MFVPHNDTKLCNEQEILYEQAMSPCVLVAWLGNTDLRAAGNELGGELGPIGQAVHERDFNAVHLLTDHTPQQSKAYRVWLNEQCGIKAALHAVSLTSPTRFDEIYEAAVSVLNGLRDKANGSARFVYHLSPGTPAMAAVWVVLAKTTHAAELIESSVQDGVRTVSFPFDLAAEYQPPINADQIVRLTQGLPAEAPEFGAIIHRCQAMKTEIARARRLAVHDVPVLIQGESGTGKELFARAIHASSPRAGQPFVEVNCGAIPSELVEAEFFGATKGAFTGAEAKVGYLEAAHTGTLFLDEIGELPLAAQVKLLRCLQEGSVQRIGSTKPRKINIRVIAATNRTLQDEVAEQRFREDLFHRLAVGVLCLPALRERTGDVGLLIDHVLEKINTDCAQQSGWVHKQLSVEARNLLLQHPWPGNIRELSNTLSRAAIWTVTPSIDAQDIRAALFPVRKEAQASESVLNRSLSNGFDLPGLLAEVARHYLSRALGETRGNKSAACRLVGLPNYQTFTNWMNKYGVK